MNCVNHTRIIRKPIPRRHVNCGPLIICYICESHTYIIRDYKRFNSCVNARLALLLYCVRFMHMNRIPLTPYFKTKQMVTMLHPPFPPFTMLRRANNTTKSHFSTAGFYWFHIGSQNESCRTRPVSTRERQGGQGVGWQWPSASNGPRLKFPMLRDGNHHECCNPAFVTINPAVLIFLKCWSLHSTMRKHLQS